MNPIPIPVREYALSAALLTTASRERERVRIELDEAADRLSEALTATQGKRSELLWWVAECERLAKETAKAEPAMTIAMRSVV